MKPVNTKLMKNTFILFVAFISSFVVQAQSTDIDKAMGEENAKMVAYQMGIYNNEAKTAYLRKVGDRLVAELEDPLFEYQFHLVTAFEPNAFALPGGYLYVTTGLLGILETEDELACILGHEIIHSNNRHSVKQLKKAILPKLLEVPGNLIGLLDKGLGAVFNAPIRTSNALLAASYSRDYESEADKEGVRLALRAGYDPNAMITALTRLSKTVEVATGMAEERSYFSDHPFTEDRAAAIRKDMKNMAIAVKAPESNNFLMEWDNTIFGETPGKGVFKENLFYQPDFNYFLEFPEGWEFENELHEVVSVNKAQTAGMQVVVLNKEDSPEVAAKAFIETLEDEYKHKITSSESKNLNGNKAYRITFVDRTPQGTVLAEVYWVKMHGNLFRLISINEGGFSKETTATFHSFRPLTKKEKDGITGNYLRVTKAKNGETLEELSERTNNKLIMDVLLVLNDKQKDDQLKEGEQVKIVLPGPYVPNQK